MRFLCLFYISCWAAIASVAFAIPDEGAIVQREAVSNSSLPSIPPSGGNTLPTTTEAPISSSSKTASVSATVISKISNSTSLIASSTSKPVATPTPTSHNGTIVNPQVDTSIPLPIQPKITPAFGIAGVILIITGTAYCLIGVKNRWIQIFLSVGYLCSLSICVLIDYVMNPPVSDAIQGAYFVGIFMTGALFGAGALIFKEITEGLGCLLGGFCLSMWFLTLKEGGLITNTTGKAILIAVFCVVVWSFSFSRYTRDYALIGSTSFSGATALVLGVDCFSRAGLKEFWFYIWALNPNLFPINTTTYPITKGTRVETIVIVLGSIIGIMSQIKLWRVLRDRQKKRDAEKIEEDRRKDVVEEALGRHIQRQNDRDRTQWEKQYGDRLNSKRNTVLWSDAHPDKRHTNVSIIEYQTRTSASSESLEMSAFGPRKPPSMYGSKNKRQSTMTVDVIHEVEEGHEPNAEQERQKALAALEDDTKSTKSALTGKTGQTINTVTSVDDLEKPKGPDIIPLPFKIPTAEVDSLYDKPSSPTALSVPSPVFRGPSSSKRRSLQSLLSLSSRLSTEKLPSSESQEALVLPVRRLSQASSLAATLDEQNDHIDDVSLKSPTSEPQTPKIIISPVASFEDLKREKSRESRLSVLDAPPSPPALSIEFDPEELARPPTSSGAAIKLPKRLSEVDSGDMKNIASESTVLETDDPSRLSNSHSKSRTSLSSAPDGLTKGFLEQVPSQVSNVVLSYRTNEWAKHITTADAPMYDEPQSIDDEEVTDLPTQLSDCSLAAVSHPVVPPPDLSVTTNSTKISPMQSPIAIPEESEGISTISRPISRSSSYQKASNSSTDLLSRPTSSSANRPSHSKTLRSSSTPVTIKQNHVPTTIDENAAMNFAMPVSVNRKVSTPVMARSVSQSSFAPANGANSTRMSTSGHVTPGPLSRSASQISFQEMPGYMSRPTSQRSNASLLKSNTRLDTYDSRQPTKREHAVEAEKREILLAEWRLAQQHGAQNMMLPKANVEDRRAQMMMDKEQKRLREEQQRHVLQQKQIAIDQVMRRPDMQDLHREALRKMQANANKAL